MWHYIYNGNQIGPVNSEEIKSLIEQGIIESTTLVWKPGMNDWVVVTETELENLFSHNSPPPLPSPPPIPNQFFSFSSRRKAIYAAKSRYWVHLILWLFIPFGPIISCAKTHFWWPMFFYSVNFVINISILLQDDEDTIVLLFFLNLFILSAGLVLMCLIIRQARKFLGVEDAVEIIVKIEGVVT